MWFFFLSFSLHLRPKTLCSYTANISSARYTIFCCVPVFHVLLMRLWIKCHKFSRKTVYSHFTALPLHFEWMHLQCMYGTWELWWLSGADFLSLRQIYTYICIYDIMHSVLYIHAMQSFFSAHSSQCRWHETLILRMSTRIFLQLDLGWSKNHQLAISTRVIQKVTESYKKLYSFAWTRLFVWFTWDDMTWNTHLEDVNTNLFAAWFGLEQKPSTGHIH